jgi:hypothetical protein
LPLIGAILLLWAAFSVLAAEAQDNKITVRVKTVPGLTDARPLSGPVRLVLETSDSSGNPVDVERISIRLRAPGSHWFFSTDLPLVEGSLLSEMIVPVSRGRVVWEYLFPIRGVYRLEVESVDDGGPQITEALELRIKESRIKLLFLAAFILALFLFGFTAGRFFTSPRPQPSLKMTMGIFVLLTVSTLTSTMGRAAVLESGGLVARMQVEPATVGRPSRIDWSVVDVKSGEPVASRLSLTITHLEKGTRIFSLEEMLTEGNFSLSFQFTDGARHQVTSVAAIPGEALVVTEETISVQAVEPPLGTVLPSIGFFIAVMAFGLIVGRISRQRLGS